MEEILHHLGCIKPYKLKDIYISTGAGFFHQPYVFLVGQTSHPKESPRWIKIRTPRGAIKKQFVEHGSTILSEK